MVLENYIRDIQVFQKKEFYLKTSPLLNNKATKECLKICKWTRRKSKDKSNWSRESRSSECC
jgi:hypothetical protein